MDEDLLKRYRKVFSQNAGDLRNVGALREIYVFETNGQDWQFFLPFLQTSPYTVEFLIDGEPRPLPERVEDLFALTQNNSVICIDREHLQAHCYCFGEEGMEFDVSTKEFQDEAAIGEQTARLLAFIRIIGQLLHKVIILAPESSPDFPLFRYDPSTQEEHWFLEHIEAIE
jgi:hypothetical protein